MSTSPSEVDVRRAINLLDGLLGVEARKPGAAAKLPAVIRVIEELEPAGGFEFPVFPASYAGEGQNAPPVYDMSGIEYGPELELVKKKDRDRSNRQILKARQCTFDSPQSQANRTETAFLEDENLKSLVPQAAVTIPRANGANGTESILRLPHRVADFRVRLSDKGDAVKSAIQQFEKGNALELLRLMPTSVVFGFWDSRAEESKAKHARILLSRIDAFDVIPCTKRILYCGPYSKGEFAGAVLANENLTKAVQDEEENENQTEETKASTVKKALKKMAARGYTNALSSGLGGVLVKGGIQRLSLVSLTDIARLWCTEGESNDQKINLTNTGRRYVFALAALAEGYPRSTGSHRLRSGCELITNKTTVDLRGCDGRYDPTEELKELFTNRDVLKAVAEDATKILKIPSKICDFNVSKESLEADFDGTNGPVSGSPTAGEPAPSGQRTRRRASR